MSLRFDLGDITIYRIVETEAPAFDPLQFFPGLTQDFLTQNRAWLQPRYIDPVTGKLILCIQSYLVVTPHHNILVDSCVGNHKPRPARPFWHMQSSDRYERNFAATGLSVNDIDYVMCTHLHVDHVGWNTRLENGRWVPTFPRARYLMADRELAFWTERQKVQPETCPWIADSVLPIVAARRAELVRSDHALNDLVRMIPTPGHTIDHFSVHVGRKDHDAVITGDMIHCPIQAHDPDIAMYADYDSKLAAASRRQLFGRFCDTPTLICTAHFPSPSAGHVTRRGAGFDIVGV